MANLGVARWISAVGLVVASAMPVAAQTQFVNFELPPVHPMQLISGGTTLVVANTADDRIEIIDVSITPRWVRSIPVGLSPVSVRARTDTEIWVTNQLSDTISIVDLTTGNVVKTLSPGDEPVDVIFAGSPQRAFVSVMARNQVAVYDPANLSNPPVIIPIEGQNPSSLATDGTRVYVGIRESGNRTSIVPREQVSEIDGPYAGVNPPPNSGTEFFPPFNMLNPPAPPDGIVVRKVGAQWLDDNTGDWSAKVPWDVVDHDVAIIDASTLSVSYVTGMMNMIFALAVQPSTGRLFAVGTEAMNDIRFEPNVKSHFVRVHAASFMPDTPSSVSILDLNPHLNYTEQSIPQSQRNKSIGDPRGIAINDAGNRIFVTGMGSNNLTKHDSNFVRLGDPLALGEGACGVTIDSARERVYVLNRFEGTVSVVDSPGFFEIARVSFYDPTPAVINAGRPLLYNTHLFSGLGQASCGSCHIDGHIDQLVWDLGDPSGGMTPAPQDDCAPNQPPPPFVGMPCPDFHPMKGPMRTQTLAGIVNHGPMHWRGDRATLHAFDLAFPNLLGADDFPTTQQIQEMEDFIATIKFQPNPFRTINDLLPSSIPGVTGNPITGQNIMFINGRVGNTISCITCHEIQGGGTDLHTVPGAFLGEPQTLKTPHLRNMYRKVGFDKASQSNLLGFGFTHDGAVGTLFEFFSNPIFTFPAGQTGINERNHVAATMLAFSSGTHPAIGRQITFDGINNGDTALVTLFNSFITVANTNNVGLVAKGIYNGQRRGFQYMGGNNFQSDIATETVNATTLRTAAVVGGEITFTIVPKDTQRRIGIDRDADGFFDGDELIACSNPTDPTIIPGGPGAVLVGDANGDMSVGLDDIAVVVINWFLPGSPGTDGDLDGDGVRGLSDIALVAENWGRMCGLQ